MTTDKPTREVVPRRLASYKFPRAMLDRLKAKAEAEKTSVTGLLERGAELVLAEPEQPQHTVTITERRTVDRRQDDRRQEERRVVACGRCGHPETMHWSRGCSAGCNCSERLFRKAVER